MKKIFFIILTTLFLSFASPQNILAQSCSAVGQTCCQSALPLLPDYCNKDSSGNFLDCDTNTNTCAPNTTTNYGVTLNSQGAGVTVGGTTVGAGGGASNTIHGSCGNNAIDTAIGCISTDATDGGFVSSILEIAIGLGGGIALLLMLYGIFLVTTSAGIPDKLNAGKQIIESAIGGLLFIILSIVLLNIIGVKILAIPGL